MNTTNPNDDYVGRWYLKSHGWTKKEINRVIGWYKLQQPVKGHYLRSEFEEAVADYTRWKNTDPNSLTQAEQIAGVEKNPARIKKITNPSEAVQMAAIRKHPDWIKDIENPTEAVQLAAVMQSGFAIFEIDNPSEELQIEAVQTDPECFVYMAEQKPFGEPSEAVQLAVVETAPFYLEFIQNPSEAVRAAAEKAEAEQSEGA